MSREAHDEERQRAHYEAMVGIDAYRTVMHERDAARAALQAVAHLSADNDGGVLDRIYVIAHTAGTGNGTHVSDYDETRRADDAEHMFRAAERTSEIYRHRAQLLEEVLFIVRDQRDALAADRDPYSFDGPEVPCGDGRCYCGGCVL